MGLPNFDRLANTRPPVYRFSCCRTAQYRRDTGISLPGCRLNLCPISVLALRLAISRSYSGQRLRNHLYPEFQAPVFQGNAIARATGFEYYYGMEDMPMLPDYSGQKSLFGWGLRIDDVPEIKTDAAKKPLSRSCLPAHHPHTTAGKWAGKYPHGENTENGFLNTLHYSDWSLGQFMKTKAAAPWFDQDTIFIFTADHNFDVAQCSFQNPSAIIPRWLSIPLSSF